MFSGEYRYISKLVVVRKYVTLWGPVIGAIAFHLFKEGFWTFFLGWQYVALGALIVIVVIFFPEGIMGWLREKYPERFGEVIDEEDRKAQVELK